MNAYSQDFEAATPEDGGADAVASATPRLEANSRSVMQVVTGNSLLGRLIVNQVVVLGSLLAVAAAALLGDGGAVANGVVIAGVAFGLGYGLFNAVRIIRGSVIPMYAMGNAMVRIAHGKRNTIVPGTERDDEVGTLARALDQFAKWGFERDDLAAERREMDEQRMEMANRRRQALDEIAADFETTMGNVAGSVAASASQLHAAATSMEAAAAESITQTEEVSRAMQQNTEGVTSVAATSDEFALSIAEISRQVALSAELARDAGTTASSANDTVSSLSASADQIGTIVELISSIAKRTNLLALNASIESARGGEAGRGFAVVAAEVKELAAQTGRATDEVAKQIRAIQDSTGDSVAALQAIGAKINQLEETAVSIASAVDQQSVAGQELARNIDMAARSTSEISDKLAKLREAATTSGAAATQTLGSANELERQASTLTTQGDRFLSTLRQV